MKRIAENILSELDNFEKNFQIVGSAHGASSSGSVIANPDSISSPFSAQQNLRNISTELFHHQNRLKKEPFVVFVKTEQEGKIRNYLICRSYTPNGIFPVTPDSVFVNYKAPIGQIAEVEADDSLYFRGREIHVLEKNSFRPQKVDSIWDGFNNNFSFTDEKFSIKSLRELLALYDSIIKEHKESEYAEEISDLEARIIKELEERLNVTQGIKRDVINKMAFRDQPILDREQGEIFRLPLSSQIILTGAPGTGKTTTLIKRIAQKSDPDLIDEFDRKKLREDQLSEFFSDKNWVMFAPTQLLKMFLKESFSNESIPASDKRIKIWDEERRVFGREILNFLKIGDKGLFKSTKNDLIKPSSNEELIEYATFFVRFYANLLFYEFEKAIETLKGNNISHKLLTKLHKIKSGIKKSDIASSDKQKLLLIERLFALRDFWKNIDQEIKEAIEVIVNKIINSKENILDEIYELIQIQKTGSEEHDTEEDAEEEPLEDDDENIENAIIEPKIIAKRQLAKTVNWLANSLALKKKINEKTLHFEILQSIKGFLPSNDQLELIGKKIVDRRATNNLTKGYSNLLNRIPRYYQTFRLTQIKAEKSYIIPGIEQKIRDRMISSPEIDLLIFLILKNANTILKSHPDLIENNSKNEILEAIKSKFATQIVVDEATDFSSIQLGSMYYMAHPYFQSVTFAGDLMQRVTSEGLTDWKQCEFISTTFSRNQIDKVYRQSAKLTYIAAKLYKTFIGKEPPFGSAFDIEAADPEPLRFDSQNDDEAQGQWIADRIVEIHKINNSLPSVAVFVADDSQIERAVEILEEPLEQNSIAIKGCPKGEVLSTESQVRVFSVKYIKGLEFESVFFLDINKISERAPELVEKYLYVGLTRAANFLAVTYNHCFPEKIDFVFDDFKTGDWNYDMN